MKTELLKEYGIKTIEKVFQVLEIKIESRNKIIPIEYHEKEEQKNIIHLKDLMNLLEKFQSESMSEKHLMN